MTVAAASQPAAAQSATVQSAAVQAPSVVEHERAMSDYGKRAEARAYALGNRGPIRIGTDGKLLPEILESYWTHGFYVFQGVVGPEDMGFDGLADGALQLLIEGQAPPGVERLEDLDQGTHENDGTSEIPICKLLTKWYLSGLHW